jgi:predicted O-linked N-acetylglucosamine transferase (SPINDLY family)
MSALAAALAAFQRGDPAPALALLQRLPGDPHERLQALMLAVNAGILGVRIDAVIEALGQLARLQPTEPRWSRMLADAHNRRGAQRREDRDLAAARLDFEAALQIAPAHPLARANLAICLRDGGDLPRAAREIAAHLSAHPDDAEAGLVQAEIELAAGRRDSAAGLLEALLAKPSPELPRGARLALALAKAGLAEPAADEIERATQEQLPIAFEAAEAIRREGEPGATRRAFASLSAKLRQDGRVPALRADIAAELHLDPLPLDRGEISAQRKAFAAGLDRLEARWDGAALAQLQPALEQAAWSNFYLAYHGENDRALQSRYGDFLARVAARLLPLPTPAANAAGPLRVGFLSSSFRECTAGNYFGRWPGLLAEAGFEVSLFQLGPLRDATTERIAQGLHRFVFHEAGLDELARAIHAAGLDLLIYPELGMDMRLLPLAALRLAPRQAMAWGHPVSSGLPHIDACFSCADMEGEDAAAHYRERLLPLPGLGVDYLRPPAPEPGPLPALPEGPRLLVPQSSFKLHPDNDAVIAAIAARLPAARILLFRAPQPRWQQRLAQRLDRALRAAGADPHTQLHWLDETDRATYLRINQACDLMLDSLHWSGGNTSLDALACGLPVLTCPGRFLRGRQSLAMLRRLGLEADLVATTPEALSMRAATLLAEPETLAGLSQRIALALPGLFEAGAARQAFVEQVRALCQEARQTP